MRTLEDRSRRNNIRVKGIPGSENEGWNVTEENLRKVIKDEQGFEDAVIKRVHRVKRNNDNNENLHYLHYLKSHKVGNFYFKEDF